MAPSINNYIWYERHRPDKLKQLVLPKTTMKILRSYIKDGDIPHLCFHGPQGSGKTTVAQIIMDAIPC